VLVGQGVGGVVPAPGGKEVTPGVGMVVTAGFGVVSGAVSGAVFGCAAIAAA
jgi:hypothetical protein